MKILQLATSNQGGAGIAARRLHKAFLENKLDSDLYTLNEISQSADIWHEFQLNRMWVRRLWSSFVTLTQRLLVQKGERLITTFSLSETKVLRKIIQDYDVIHLHATYNLVDLAKLPQLIGKSQHLYLHLHDQRAFTGGCHYSSGCLKYKNDCNKCPQVKIPFRNSPKRELLRNVRTYQNISRHMTVVSPSKWLMDVAIDSKAFKGIDVIQVRNPVPDVYFKNISSKNLKFQKISFVVSSLDNPYKGFEVFCEAINLLPKEFFTDKLLHIIGKGRTPEFPSYVKYKHDQSLTDREMMNFYSTTNLLVVPSLEDNYPNVISEALAQGCEIVGSNVGGISETLRDFEMQLFEKGSSQQLSAILKAFEFRDRRDVIRLQAAKILSNQSAVESFLADYRERIGGISIFDN